MEKILYIGRYAPSPSGRLHLGNMLSSLLAWLDVRANSGSLIFRLEDLDPQRSYTEYAALMAEDLLWLGLSWDMGWRPGEGFAYTQGARTSLYQDAFELLCRRGLVYPCYCSRAQRLAASAPHPGDAADVGCRCRELTALQRSELKKAGRAPAWKVRVPDQSITFIDGHYGKLEENLADSGDFIIRRSDGVFAYQLAVSVDDAAMGVTNVVRARDLLSSTARQIWLIGELGGTPPTYCHAPLLTAPNGRKLSKREGDLNMETLRRRYSPEELTGILARMAGLRDTDAPVEAQNLIADFSWSRVGKADIIITI
jgi:glutamyl-tRNA synthetase